MEESGGDSHLLLGLATGSGLGGLGGLGLGGFRGLWIGWGGGAQVSHRDRGAKNPSGSFSAQPRPEMRDVEGLANPLRAHPTADGSGTIVRYGRGAHHLRRYSPSSCKEGETCRDSGLLLRRAGSTRVRPSVLGRLQKNDGPTTKADRREAKKRFSRRSRIVVVPASLDRAPARPRTHAVDTHAAETMLTARPRPAKPREAARRPVDPARRRAPFALLVALFAAMTRHPPTPPRLRRRTIRPSATTRTSSRPSGWRAKPPWWIPPRWPTAAPRSPPGTPRGATAPRSTARRSSTPTSTPCSSPSWRVSTPGAASTPRTMTPTPCAFPRPRRRRRSRRRLPARRPSSLLPAPDSSSLVEDVAAGASGAGAASLAAAVAAAFVATALVVA